MLDLLCVVTGTEGQFITDVRVKKTGLRVILEHFEMPATLLLDDKALCLLYDIDDVLTVNRVQAN